LREHLGDKTFADLEIPCAVTAVDIDRPHEVILADGPVVEALLATIAVPGIFPPYQTKDARLVDGGVLDPVPVSVARLLNPSLPIAAVVLSRRMGLPVRAWSVPLSVSLPFQLKTRLTRLRYAQAFNLFMESVELGGRAVAELRLQIDKPDVVIRPDVGEIDLLEEVDVREVAKLGEAAAEAALPELRKAVSWQGRLRRKFSREKTCYES
jgi:NTE family protein